MARQGARQLGDNREMLEARRRFLGQGHYAPLSTALNERIDRALDARRAEEGLDGHLSVLDVGCGEGYFLNRLSKRLRKQHPATDFCFFGMDISKEAVRLAARDHDEIHFFVADVNERLLFAEASVHVLLNVFSPRNLGEFDRVLADDGLVLVVIPTAEHLAGLRSQLGLLDVEPEKQKHLLAEFSGAFRLQREVNLAFDLHLETEQVLDVLKMTPNYWHLQAPDWRRARSLGAIDVHAGFTILEFCR
jgi:23S rRNA (guanine745-N1)-methyltransferase